MTRILAALLGLAALPAAAQEAIATAEVAGTDGNAMGTVTLSTSASGTMLVTLDLQGVPEGQHGVHIHETGDCSADDFSSAGGHLAGDAQHGVLVEGGPHPGDLPNVTAGPEGVVKVEYFNERLERDLVFDDDGAAFIVHAEADDYESQPAGDAGDRIACGVFEES